MVNNRSDRPNKRQRVMSISPTERKRVLRQIDSAIAEATERPPCLRGKGFTARPWAPKFPPDISNEGDKSNVG